VAEITENPDVASHRKWLLIADKVERDPGLLSIPLENIARWSSSRSDGLDKLEYWRQAIESARKQPEALASLLELLRDDSENARHLKSFSPFPGVLTSEEVDRFTCSWRH